MSRDAVHGHLDGLLLVILAGGPAHGYGLIEQLRNRSGGYFELPEGSVYPALHRLERAGLIESGWSTAEGRRRRVYTLTAHGHAAAADRRSEWQSFATAVNAVFTEGN